VPGGVAAARPYVASRACRRAREARRVQRIPLGGELCPGPHRTGRPHRLGAPGGAPLRRRRDPGLLLVPRARAELRPHRGSASGRPACALRRPRAVPWGLSAHPLPRPARGNHCERRRACTSRAELFLRPLFRGAVSLLAIAAMRGDCFSSMATESRSVSDQLSGGLRTALARAGLPPLGDSAWEVPR